MGCGGGRGGGVALNFHGLGIYMKTSENRYSVRIDELEDEATMFIG